MGGLEFCDRRHGESSRYWYRSFPVRLPLHSLILVSPHCFVTDRYFRRCRSAQDFSIFSPTNSIPDYLPDPSFLASFLPNHALQLIDQLTHAVTFYLYTGREVATHFAKPYPATVQEDFKTLQAAWNRLDTLASWIGDCAKLFWAENLVESYGLTALRVSRWKSPTASSLCTAEPD